MTSFKLTKAKGTKTAAVPKPPVVSTVTPILSEPLPPKALTTFTIDEGNSLFTATPSNNVAITAFDYSTGVDSQNPEIISFADFIPLYDDAGNLSAAGQALQVKQDALFLSAKKSIDSTLALPTIDAVIQQLKSNETEINSFCESFISDINGVFNTVDAIKKKFDFRVPFTNEENQTLIQLNPTDPNYPASAADILFDSSPDIENWTNTKTWVRSCLELKEVLKRGLPNGLLSDSTIVPSVQNSSAYKDPYTLLGSSTNNDFPPRSRTTRFGFKPQQFSPGNFKNYGDVPGEQEFNQFVSDISTLYDVGLFSEANTSDVPKHVARMCYVLSKEHVFSKALKSSIFDTWYTASGFQKDDSVSGKYRFWDYVIGQSGTDVTEIPVQLGNTGFSAINLAQSRQTITTQANPSQTSTIEVLTFENEYIIDNIGTRRDDVVMTPGSYFYLESNLKSSIDPPTLPQNLQALDEQLDKFKSFFDTLRKELVFSATPRPRQPREIIATINQQPQNSLGLSAYYSVALEHPIELFRKISNQVLVQNGLLDRNKFIQLSNPAQVSASPNFGPALLREATLNKRLMALLFVYVAGIINEDFNATVARKLTTIEQQTYEPPSDDPNDLGLAPGEPIVKKAVVNISYQELITQEIIKILETKPQGASSKKNNYFFVEELFNELNAKNSSASTTFAFFKSIAEFMNSLLDPVTEENVYAFETKNGIENYYTFYSSISRTTFFCGLFELICYIVSLATADGFGPLKEGEPSKIIVEQIAEPFVSVSGNIKILNFENYISRIETSIAEENRNFKNYLSRFYYFIAALYKQINPFKNNFATISSTTQGNVNPLSRLAGTTREIIGDPALAQLLITKEQLSLVKSKLSYLKKRTTPTYSSEIKNVLPYFLELKDNPDLDLFLPLEDTHLGAWNFFLKDFFKNDPKFRQSEAFNKKIASIAIPQGLVRRLSRKYASNYNSNLRLAPIIKINLYRVDELRPSLVHKPLSFLFNANEYPTRILNHYVSGTLEAESNSIVSPVLNEDQKKQQNETRENHKTSFILEEYLKFTTSTFFDEQKYQQYDLIKPVIDAEFQKFLQSTGANVSYSPTSSTTKYYTEENLLTNLEALKKSLIMPKKFDRVFHVLFDPDDFEVYVNPADPKATTAADIELYNDVIVTRNENGQLRYLRRQTRPEDITFDSYFTQIELI